MRAQPSAPEPQSFKYTRAEVWSLRLTFSSSHGCARIQYPPYGWYGARTLRDLLAAQLSYDPFIPFHFFTNPDDDPRNSDAAYATAHLIDHNGQLPKQVGHLTVKVDQTSNSTRLTAIWLDENGEPKHKPWTFTRDGTDRYACTQVLRTLATVLAAEFPLPKFEPLPVCPAPLASGPAERTAVCPEYRYAEWPPEGPMSPLKPRPDPPKPLERWPSALRFGIAVWPELIATGWSSLGLSAEAGARFRAVSLNFEVHGDPSLGSKSYPFLGAVSFARVSGALVLCAHVSLFAGCGVADAGRFLFPDHSGPIPASYFYGAAGVRMKLEVPIAPPRLFFSTALDVRAPIRQAHFTTGMTSNITTVFDSAVPEVGLAGGLLLELPP
jgi:hypothetical protein